MSGLTIVLLMLLSSTRNAQAGVASVTAAQHADWPMWGHDLSNHRYNPDESMITRSNVNRLQLHWAFVFPDTMIASSQPTVIGDTVYVGSWNGSVYALDAATGKEKWHFFTGITGKTGTVRIGVVVAQGLVLFGDQLGRFFAVNQNNGTLAWIQQDFEKHPLAQITGSPVVYGDRVYVPMSSREENAATNPKYPCCTFRGSLTALNIRDGSVAWRFYTVGEPKPLSSGGSTGPSSGPSGVGIWSTPAIDPDAGLIYVSTDNSYSPPASPYSDSLLALNLNDGSVRWSTQLTIGDWNNKGCDATPAVNCEGNSGHDLGFGAAPLLFTVQTSAGVAKRVTAQQKTGTLHVLDALTGNIVWEKSLGVPISYAWGAAYDGQRLYVSDSSYGSPGNLYAIDPATGALVWNSGALSCIPAPEQAAADCWAGYMAAPVSSPGLVWLGAMDGQVRAFDANTGQVLWSYNTARVMNGVNGLVGHGGSIGPANATIANGTLFVTSGYAPWNGRIITGNVLYAFGLATATTF